MDVTIPKIELHVHLEGSVRISTLAELSSLSLEEASVKATTSSNCQDWKEYLSYYDFPITVMQTKESLRRIARELSEDLKEDHVIYAEVRLFPLAHTHEGLAGEEVIDAVLEGFQEGEIPIHLILCMNQEEDGKRNVEVIQLTKRFLGKGVVALALPENEDFGETESSLELLKLIQDLNIPFIYPVGPKNMAHNLLGTSRVEYRGGFVQNRDLFMTLKEKKILLEMCPTSNIQTKVVKNIKEHPIGKMYQMGIPVCINTDNRTISFTNLEKEYRLLSSQFSLEDFCTMNRMAIEGSFASREEKERLKEVLYQYQNQFKEWR